MENLVKLVMNSLYGVLICKDINDSNFYKSEQWMMKTESDENLLDSWKLPNGNYFVKMKKDDGLDDNCHIRNTLPAHLGSFISNKSKRSMNNFVREFIGFYNIIIHYTDTDSL